MFPAVNGSNLNKVEYTLPEDFEAEFNIVVVAFQQWHQRLVNSWVPLLEELTGGNPRVEYYELPTIRKMNFVYRGFIDGGMRAGIPSKDTRGRTITLYIDKDPFKKELAIPSEENIHLFLVRPSGEILWRSEGPLSEEGAMSLTSAVEKALGEVS
jgi:hypothetical protein